MDALILRSSLLNLRRPVAWRLTLSCVCRKETTQNTRSAIAALTFPVALVRLQLEKHEDAIVKHVKSIDNAVEETEVAICSNIAAYCDDDDGRRAEL